jgi:hypothetical protein
MPQRNLLRRRTNWRRKFTTGCQPFCGLKITAGVYATPDPNVVLEPFPSGAAADPAAIGEHQQTRKRRSVSPRPTGVRVNYPVGVNLASLTSERNRKSQLATPARAHQSSAHRLPRTVCAEVSARAPFVPIAVTGGVLADEAMQLFAK